MRANSTVPDFGNVFAAVALLILPLATVAPLAIAWVALIPVVWIAFIYMRSGRAPWHGRSRLIPAALAGLIVYGAVTGFWSLSPDRSLHIAVKIIPIIVCGWLLVGAAAQLDERGRRRTSQALLIGGGIAILVIAVEVATGGLIQALLRGEGFNAPLYSPAHGDTAFTVPLFDGSMKRIMPEIPL